MRNQDYFPERASGSGQTPRSPRLLAGFRERGGRSRRAVLRASAAGAAMVATGWGTAGCGLFSDDPDKPPAPDPLAGLLAGTMELISRYDAALAAHPELADRLTPVRQAHQAHATELAALIGTPTPSAPAGTAAPTGGGVPAGTSGVLAALRAAEAGGRRAAVTACLAAPPDRAPLLGSIAAARACHAEVLR